MKNFNKPYNEKYVINITKLLNSNAKKRFKAVGNDLALVSKAIPNIDSIVLRGGAVYDIMLDLEPNDYDLFYSYKTKNKFSNECLCDEIKQTIEKLKLSKIDNQKIDLENSYEKEPQGSPIERTCGLTSFHTDYNSMLCVDKDGQVYSNSDSWEYIKNAEYELRYEGFLPWIFFPHKGDTTEFYSFSCYVLIRSISYVNKRDLRIGKNLRTLLLYAPYYLEQGLSKSDPNGFKKFASKKIGTMSNAQRFIDKLDFGGKYKKELANSLSQLFS